MQTDPQQTAIDEEQLRWLILFSRVFGVICMCLGSFPLIHAIIGYQMMVGAFPVKSTSPEPISNQFFGGLLLVFAVLFIAFGWTLAVLNLLSAERIERRCGFKLVQLTTILNLFMAPFGLALGIFALMTLTRPSVRSTFGTEPRAPS